MKIQDTLVGPKFSAYNIVFYLETRTRSTCVYNDPPTQFTNHKMSTETGRLLLVQGSHGLGTRRIVVADKVFLAVGIDKISKVTHLVFR